MITTIILAAVLGALIGVALYKNYALNQTLDQKRLRNEAYLESIYDEDYDDEDFEDVDSVETSILSSQDNVIHVDFSRPRSRLAR